MFVFVFVFVLFLYSFCFSFCYADKQDILRACHSRNDTLALSIISNIDREEHFEIDAILNDLGDTALIFCVSFQAETVALKLIELGANVTIRTTTGDSALTWAASRNLPNVVQALLQKNAESNILVDGMSPLFYSCRDNHTEIALMLLEIGEADPNIGSQNGIGSLAHAVANGNPTLTKALLKRGANTELVISSGPAVGNTPVTLCKNAVEKYSEEMIQACEEVILISNALADKREIRVAKNGLASICNVTENISGQLDQAVLFLKSLQKIKGGIINVDGSEKRTALQIAEACENKLVRKALLEALFTSDEDPRLTFFERLWYFFDYKPRKINSVTDL
jgi:hypothetical protein